MTDERPVGHLQRRKIEGRVLVPFIGVCRERLGDEVTRELVAAFIRQASIDDGARSAERFGGDMAGTAPHRGRGVGRAGRRHRLADAARERTTASTST
jgi:hypothetical protein